MGTRTRIAKPDGISRARQCVRELYYDMLGPLSNNECDKIIEARADGLGDMFIVDIITKKRSGRETFVAEREKMYVMWKQKSPAK